MAKRHIPGHLSHKKKRKSRGFAPAALTACLVLLVLLTGAAIGRYQRQLSSDGSVKALNFYFTSNLLDGGTYTLAPGSTEVAFTLGNHADDLRSSEVDITYKVSVDNGASVENGEGTLEKNVVLDKEITISKLTAGTYTVTAVGTGGAERTGNTGGYSKTLTATIVIPAEGAQLYWYQDNSSGEYTLLTVWNEGAEPGDVSITYTGIPDNTNPNMTDWSTNGTQAVKIDPYESRVFRFFGETVTVTGADYKEPY